jgi:hypothetical protein
MLLIWGRVFLVKKKWKPPNPWAGHWGIKNEIGHMTHQSIGNFEYMNKEHTLGGQKGESKPSEPKNGIFARWLLDYGWMDYEWARLLATSARGSLIGLNVHPII